MVAIIQLYPILVEGIVYKPYKIFQVASRYSKQKREKNEYVNISVVCAGLY